MRKYSLIEIPENMEIERIQFSNNLIIIKLIESSKENSFIDKLINIYKKMSKFMGKIKKLIKF